MRNTVHPQGTTANKFDHWVKGRLEALNRFAGGDATFYDTTQLAWVKTLESHFPAIQRELLSVLEKEKVPSWESISNDPNVSIGESWKTLIFCTYRKFVEANCRKCPETFKAIQQIPGLTTAWFSILEPNTRLPEHEGPYNGVLRYHLGLLIPSQDIAMCGIRVGHDVRNWAEGKSLLFDDTHPHEAWNLSEKKRVVLFVDVVRPLPFPVSVINKFAIHYAGKSAFVSDLIDNAGKRS